jgi:site-specific DNA-cytosine methylase
LKALDPALKEVARRIAQRRLSAEAAAREIGVTKASLERHLSGEYVRSDSLAKYRRWLSRNPTIAPTQLELLEVARRPAPKNREFQELVETRLGSRPERPDRPYLVVDLFSGCGGMSLGFDLFEAGRTYETVLAIDIEEPMVRVFNSNNPGNGGSFPVCRHVDLSEFLNEAEVLAFYLDHLTTVKADSWLKNQLENLPILGIPTLVATLARIDASFLNSLQGIRESSEYAAAYKRIPASTFGQTSVRGFHETLHLPVTSSGAPQLGPLVWADRAAEPVTATPANGLFDSQDFHGHCQEFRVALQQSWDDEVNILRLRADGAGRGQLASSASRIRAFLPFLQGEAMQQVRAAWLDWQSKRCALRSLVFGEQTREVLRAIYDHERYRVSLVLGGPPCQGFSRIGRGKLRSLRDQHVHVQADPEAGDRRNQLLHKYVLFVSALAPKAFLFENVRHFQTEVRTPEGAFRATEVLAEAILEISSSGLRYQISSRTVDASKHLIPETRERFFMVGVRSDVVRASGLEANAAAWCLALREHDPVPIRLVLEDLPTPIAVDEARANGRGLEQAVEIAPTDRSGAGPAAMLLRWLQQEPRPHVQRSLSCLVDAHHIRAPRADDAALFDLLGPGKRWMDYRCEKSETLSVLRRLVTTLHRAVTAAKNGRHRRTGDKVREILAKVENDELRKALLNLDGALCLRLLLESIPPLPGELQHHLLTPAYLSKREGRHGDWLARLHPDRPSKTIMSHMSKDTYAYVHPYQARTLSVREAARIQTFPDWYSFGAIGLVESFRAIGNAVPPFLSHQFADRLADLLGVVTDASDQLWTVPLAGSPTLA